MRSISPVVAIVVLMVMTVAAAGMAYLTIVSYQEEVESGTGSSLEELAASGMSSIKVESLADGKLYIRSHGNPCEGLMIQVGSQAPEELGDCNTDSTLTAFDLTSQCPEGVTGQVTMKITGSHGISHTQSIQCTDLGEETGGGAGGALCENIEAKYKPGSRVFGTYLSIDDTFYLGHNYTAQPGTTVKKIDIYMPYGNASSNERGAGTVKFYITDDTIYSTDPRTLTPDASVVVSSSDQNKWVSADLNVPVSGEFMVVVNYANSTFDPMPFAANASTNVEDYTLLLCMEGMIDCSTGMVNYEQAFGGQVMALNMIVHTSTVDPAGDLCSDGYFCDSGSCSQFLTNLGGCEDDGDCTGGESCCSNTCVDTDTDEANCGDCSITCSGTQYCGTGTCTACGGCDGFCPGGVDCYTIDPDCDSGGQPNLECCGNSVCGGSETCSSCSADCGICTYTLATFSDMSSEKILTFSGAGSDSSAKISLNLDTIIVDAQVSLDGIVQNYTLDGENAGDYFGYQFALGDINNDSNLDLLVGAHGFGTDKGRAYIFWGNSTGDFDFNRNYTIDGENDNDQFGSSVVSGDINNDNYEDLIVTATGYNSDQGKVYIFWGNETDDFTYADNYTIDGENAGDSFGYSVSMGNINNDDYIDLLVGARLYGSGFENGRAYIFWGNSTGNFTNIHNYTIDAGIWEHFGQSISSGDINNDNYDDFIVGVPNFDFAVERGAVYIFWGNSTGNFTKDNKYFIGGSGIYAFGDPVSTGDINNDNYDDLIVGVPRYNSYQGRAHVFWGNETGNFTDLRNYTLVGESGKNSHFGTSISSGDLNNDGYDELLIGARHYLASDGRGYIFWGETINSFTNTNNYTIDGENQWDEMGFFIGSGDLDKDNYDDLLIQALGWYSQDANGRIYIYKSTDSVDSPALKPGSNMGTSWSHTGKFFGPDIANMTSELNSIFPECTCYGCSYESGNCTIDLNVTSQSAGTVKLYDLEVIYASGAVCSGGGCYEEACTLNADCTSNFCAEIMGGGSKACCDSGDCWTGSTCEDPGYMENSGSNGYLCDNGDWWKCVYTGASGNEINACGNHVVGSTTYYCNLNQDHYSNYMWTTNSDHVACMDNCISTGLNICDGDTTCIVHSSKGNGQPCNCNAVCSSGNCAGGFCAP